MADRTEYKREKKRNAPLLTAERLRELVVYDPETGVMKSRVSRHRVKPGDVIGVLNSKGHLLTRISWRLYYVHRLAWLYMTGEWPTNFVDHRNGDPADNRWANLREATRAQNGRNRSCNHGNRAGTKNVYWCARDRSWRVLIKADGVEHYIGQFRDLDEARTAAHTAMLQYHGKFSLIASRT